MLSINGYLKRYLGKKNTIMNDQEVAAIPFGGLITLLFLNKEVIQSRQKVLIFGDSGAIGTSALQISMYYSAEVISICSTTIWSS